MLKTQNIPFWNFPFGRMLIFTVTYLNCFFMSNMSMALLFPTGDFDCVVSVSLGFSFLIVIDIGSLARFTCFSSVDLSSIFCSILNPFFQNTVSLLLLCFTSSLWNSFQ